MRFIERNDGEQQRLPGDDNSSDSSGSLNQARNEADRFLAAGDDAIRRALAGSNSEAFLRSAMQQGGE
ncbi:MAG: hypothetical protein ACLQHF_07655 [Terracidiphilus sp.]